MLLKSERQLEASERRNPPPLLPHRGEPLAKVCSPLPKTHIDNCGEVPLAESSAHPGSLREMGWVNKATGHGVPPSKQNHRPSGGEPLENFHQVPGDAYLPGEKTLAKFSPHPPPLRGNPRE